MGNPTRRVGLPIQIVGLAYHSSMAIMGMSDDQLLGFNRGIVEEFRDNDGKCGGRFEGNPMLLLTMTGAKSGRELVSPLTYHAAGDVQVIMASAGGAPSHPSWFYNLVAQPSVVVELGTERFEATAVRLEGSEREVALAGFAAEMPRFGDYQAGVEREIPLFRLVRK
jgi:deazaflavin-dependent oxidoreductase (nitroreductase family)